MRQSKLTLFLFSTIILCLTSHWWLINFSIMLSSFILNTCIPVSEIKGKIYKLLINIIYQHSKYSCHGLLNKNNFFLLFYLITVKWSLNYLTMKNLCVIHIKTEQPYIQRYWQLWTMIKSQRYWYFFSDFHWWGFLSRYEREVTRANTEKQFILHHWL